MPKDWLRVLGSTRRTEEALEFEYLNAVDSLIETALQTGAAHDDFFGRLNGVFPSVAASRPPIRRFGVDRLLSRSNLTVRNYVPELHPLNFEWYFTPECAKSVALEFSSKRGVTVFLGVPTSAAIATELKRTVLLIDHNPLLLKRFPALMRASEIHLMDAANAVSIQPNADSVVFDAPWCFGDMIVWLIIASRLARKGGLIAFSLFPSLVRPTARFERELILELAASIGPIELIKNKLVYETPLFEREALYGAGIVAGNWRRSDLVVVQVRHPARLPAINIPRQSAGHQSWRSFVIHGQVVKVRSHKRAMRDGRKPLIPVPGSKVFLYASVSARDRSRAFIETWTSRNRVARIGDPIVVTSLFEMLERGRAVGDAVTEVCSNVYAGNWRCLHDAVSQFLAL
jgi:hypothetical protein